MRDVLVEDQYGESQTVLLHSYFAFSNWRRVLDPLRELFFYSTHVCTQLIFFACSVERCSASTSCVSSAHCKNNSALFCKRSHFCFLLALASYFAFALFLLLLWPHSPQSSSGQAHLLIPCWASQELKDVFGTFCKKGGMVAHLQRSQSVEHQHTPVNLS